MDPDLRTPFDFTEDAATRRDLGLPIDLRIEPTEFEASPPRRPRLGRRRVTTLQKVLVGIVALVVTATMAGLGTFATFTSGTSASHQTSSGTVVVNLGATGAKTNRLNINATTIAPGDTIQRTVDIVGSGSLALASQTLTTTATTSSLLDTDTTNGLQMVVDKCSVPWTEGGVNPAFTYTCGGSITSVIASRPVVGSNLAMSNMTLGAGGGTDNIRVTLTLPTTAGNTFQGINSTINLAFTETQRAGTNS
ncbi:MAG: hypothetical protein H7288_06170 [Kineosporiaceae bacterium]|nr:hypothetical protein [Aeromicrobium sp.]